MSPARARKRRGCTRAGSGLGSSNRRRRRPREAAAPVPADAELEDRRLTGQLRRSMACYMATTAIEALDREPPQTERLLDALDERLDREGQDDADFADLDVKDLALTICRDLGVDPGPERWMEGWDIESPPRCGTRGGGGPPNGGRGGESALSASGAASAPPPQMFRSG